MKNSQKYLLAIIISLLVITGVESFGISSALAQVNTTSNVTCRLKINGLCYNTAYVKNVNNAAQTQNYNPDIATVVTSEPANQPKSYTLNSVVNRKFYLHNNSTNKINVEVTAAFYPIALIEYGTFSLQKQVNELPLQTIALGPQETKEVNFLIPTSQQTLSANIRITLRNVDNPNVGISFAYYSQPFTIYNSQDALATCQGFTFSKNFGKYMCTNDAFVPLGNIGCISSDKLRTGQQCLNNHLYPTTFPRDRSPENIKMLVANIYLTDDQNSISNYEQILNGTLSGLSNKISDIKSKVGSPKSLVIDQKKCIASRDSLLNFLNKLATSNYQTMTDGLLSLCGLSRANYTHTFLNFYPNISDSDQALITSKIFTGFPAKGRYAGDGIFISEITSIDDWPVILHEMTHSFGAPDLYTQNYVYGSTYLWGDCQLMKHDYFDQNTPLCPLENLYWGTTASNPPTVSTTPTPTPSPTPTLTPAPVSSKKAVRVAVILFGPATTSGKLYTKQQINEEMFTNQDSVKHFYEDGSFHQWSLTGDVLGEYLVPDSGDGSCQKDKWSDEALVLAKNAGVNLDNYTNIIFVFPAKESGCTLGGWHVWGGNKSWVLNPTTNTFIHELGHAFGLAHANALECGAKAIDQYSNCQDLEYGDPEDVMGGYGGPINSGVTEFNGPHKMALGWIPDSNILTVSSSGTYTIQPLETASRGIQIIKVKKSDTSIGFNDYYYLAYRQPIGVFDSKLSTGLTRGVSIVLNDHPWNSTKLIDTTPGGCVPSPFSNCVTSDFADAALSDGSSFTDPTNNITIEQVSHNSNGAVVKITVTPTSSCPVGYTCIPGTPTSPQPNTCPPGYICTANPPTTIPPTIQTGSSVTPSASIIDSGGSVRFNFSFPPNTIRASLYLACPSGITTGANPEACNKFTDVTSAADWTTLFSNSTSQVQNVVPNYYVYLSTNPNYAVGVSSQVSVKSTQISIPPVVQAGVSITPSASVINSGSSVRLTFKFPPNTIRSSLYLACPNGVTTGSINLCNQYKDVTSNSDYSVMLYNSSSQSQNIALNYYVYLSTDPNNALKATSQITVKSSSPVVSYTNQDMTASVWNNMWSFVTSLFSSKKDSSNPSTQTVPATTQTYIAVLSPSGGDRVPAGSSLIIKWESANVVSKKVLLTFHLSGITQIISPESGTDIAVPNSGLFVWKVPNSFDELNSKPVEKDYSAYITIQDEQNKNIIGRSGDFTITPPIVIGQPSIINVSGPTSMRVDEQGTWVMAVNYPVVKMDKLSVFVTWGDEQVTPALASYVGPNTASGADGGAKFSHVYKIAGLYHPTFTIIDQRNQRAEARIDVSVKN